LRFEARSSNVRIIGSFNTCCLQFLGWSRFADEAAQKAASAVNRNVERPEKPWKILQN